MNNLKGQLVLVGVAALGVAMILVAILYPGSPPPIDEDGTQAGEVASQPAGEGELDDPSDGGAAATEPPARIEPADEPAHVRLLRAASAGDTRTIESLVGMGVPVDTTASDADVRAVATPPLRAGMTALMLAARDSDLATVQALLAAGANPNARADTGTSPLMLAAQRGQTDLVVGLLGAGADPTLADTQGRTAVMLAARTGAHRAISPLLEAGADPNRADADGVTPLMLAAEGDHLDAVVVLLGGGADATATDTRGRAAIDRAAEGPVAGILREAAGG